jgi:N utilization substance protein A
MKNEFVLAFNEVIEDKQLPKEIILKALESAMVVAYQKSVNTSKGQLVEANVDPETGKVTIMAEKEVVDSVQDSRTEVSLEEARQYNPEAELGMMVIVDSTPSDFGRVAAQTARQVIQQRIREAERQAQLEYYGKQLGEIVSGIVQASNAQGLTIGLEMRAEGFISRKDMIPGERFRTHDRVRALIFEIKDISRGPQIILSRSHRDFLRRLLENEIPEIYHGVVEIRSIAREPGERAKVAVSAVQAGIDPVGACVGIRGVRIQAIMHELHGEKIDVIEWNSDPSVFIAKALSPARVAGVYLVDQSASGKTATVVVPEDQLSLAIGRDGQNARLAAKLTGWRIDIKSLTEATSDTLHRLQEEPEMEEILNLEESNVPLVENILTKKSEGRPLTPEEYDQMAHFVDRVERKITPEYIPEEIAEEDEALAEIRESLPQELFEQNILDSSLPEHVSVILQEAGYLTLGELVVMMKHQPDEILRLQGIGPRAMSEINSLMETIQASITPDTIVPESEPEEKAIVEETEVEIAQPESAETVHVIEPAEEGEAMAEPEIEGEGEQVPVVETEEESKEPEEELEETSFDKLLVSFQTSVENLDIEDEDETDQIKTKKQKKKKRKSVEIEYDPDSDRTLMKKKHRRGEDWTWDE